MKTEHDHHLGEADERREGGQPGGGQGRRDEVGGSGVYPASGPHPPGEAEVQGMASWGQGERGAAGYADHGDSEVVHIPPDTPLPPQDKQP